MNFSSIYVKNVYERQFCSFIKLITNSDTISTIYFSGGHYQVDTIRWTLSLPFISQVDTISTISFSGGHYQVDTIRWTLSLPFISQVDTIRWTLSLPFLSQVGWINICVADTTSETFAVRVGQLIFTILIRLNHIKIIQKNINFCLVNSEMNVIQLIIHFL